MKRILSIVHWLNFDTAFGAAITSLFVAQNLGVTIPNIALAALLLAVLSIYNFDHLLDAQRIKGTALSGRHRYYQQKFKQLSVYQIILLIVLLFVSWFVPTKIAQAGVVLAIIALIYFLLLFIILPQKFWLKEVIISIVYVCGLILAPVTLTEYQLSLENYILFTEVLVLALSNTIILSWFDYHLDAREGHVSLVQLIGEKKGYKLSLSLLSILGVLVLASLIVATNFKTQLIISGMGLTLLATLIFSTRFRRNEMFRIVGDAIFFIPVFSLLV